MDMEDNNDAPRLTGPPSPVSTGSAMAVGTSQEANVIQSIEQGNYTGYDNEDDDTRSLTDSIRQHIVDGGLRYHAYHAGQYAFPNDETEQYRDDLKHNLTVYLCDGYYFHAPVHDVFERGDAHVLDLGKCIAAPNLPEPGILGASLANLFQGTGTGKWCVECTCYPSPVLGSSLFLLSRAPRQGAVGCKIVHRRLSLGMPCGTAAWASASPSIQILRFYSASASC